MMFSSFLKIALVLATLTKAEITKHGLVIVDLQFDFADPSGSLSVFGNDENEYLGISSSEYVARVNTFIENEKDRFDFIVYSIDYHPEGHCSFASSMQSLGANVSAFDQMSTENGPFATAACLSQTGSQTLWPDHCVRGTAGAKLMADVYNIQPLPHIQSSADLRRVVIWRDASMDELYVTNYKLSASSLLRGNFSFKSELDHVLHEDQPTIFANVSQVMYVFKGRDDNIDTYSVFDGNDGETRTGLFDALNAYDYIPDNTDLTVFGIAYDYCVGWTLEDAVDHGYHVTVMDQLTAPVFASAVPALKETFVEMGMTVNYSYGAVDEPTTSKGTGASATGEEEDKSMVEIVVIVVLVAIILALVAYIVYDKIQQKKVIAFSPDDQEQTNNVDRDVDGDKTR